MRKSGGSRLRLFSLIVVCANLWAFDSLAQSYPVRPIRFVVGYAAGGSTDVAARLVAQKMADQLGQPVTVENRTGANGAIAVERVAKSAADGYTLLMATAGDTVLPLLRPKLPYDLERDLIPVSLIVTGPQVLVVYPGVPARNIKELIALARSQPGKLNYATSGVGGTPHLSGELFKLMAEVNIGHVPYKGGSESAVATASGQVDMLIAGVASVLPLLGSGKLRALAVTSVRRASLLPSVPTIDESGLPGYNRAGVWVGMLAPTGVSKDIITLLSTQIGKLVNTAEMKEALFKQGLEPQTNTPEQFAAFIRSELAENARLIKASDIKAE